MSMGVHEIHNKANKPGAMDGRGRSWSIYMAVGDAIHLVRNKEVKLRGLVEDLHQLVLVRCMSYGVFASRHEDSCYPIQPR